MDPVRSGALFELSENINTLDALRSPIPLVLLRQKQSKQSINKKKENKRPVIPIFTPKKESSNNESKDNFKTPFSVNNHTNLDKYNKQSFTSISTTSSTPSSSLAEQHHSGINGISMKFDDLIKASPIPKVLIGSFNGLSRRNNENNNGTLDINNTTNRLDTKSQSISDPEDNIRMYSFTDKNNINQDEQMNIPENLTNGNKLISENYVDDDLFIYNNNDNINSFEDNYDNNTNDKIIQENNGNGINGYIKNDNISQTSMKIDEKLPPENLNNDTITANGDENDNSDNDEIKNSAKIEKSSIKLSDNEKNTSSNESKLKLDNVTKKSTEKRKYTKKIKLKPSSKKSKTSQKKSKPKLNKEGNIKILVIYKYTFIFMCLLFISLNDLCIRFTS